VGKGRKYGFQKGIHIKPWYTAKKCIKEMHPLPLEELMGVSPH
jgi:hypothetical protein